MTCGRLRWDPALARQAKPRLCIVTAKLGGAQLANLQRELDDEDDVAAERRGGPTSRGGPSLLPMRLSQALYIRGRSAENGESHAARVDRQDPAREQSRCAFQLIAACLTRTRAGKCRMSAEIARGSQSLTATRRPSFRIYSRPTRKTSGWLRSEYLPQGQRRRRSSCPCCKTQRRHSNKAAHAIKQLPALGAQTPSSVGAHDAT